jgi:hypothetical protein
LLDHGGLPPIPPRAYRPSQAGGHRYPEVITAGGSKTGARLVPLSHVAPVVVCEGAVPQPQFPARQSLVTRGPGGPGARGAWGGLPVCFYASCPKTACPLHVNFIDDTEIYCFYSEFILYINPKMFYTLQQQGDALPGSRCSDLITSDARLDYSADFDWDYLRIRARSC